MVYLCRVISRYHITYNTKNIDTLNPSAQLEAKVEFRNYSMKTTFSMVCCWLGKNSLSAAKVMRC